MVVRVLLVLCVLMSVHASAEAKPTELIMVCRGDISAIGDVTWDRENEVIAAHVKNDKISLSGNLFFRSQNIRICPSGTDNLSDDERLFDTDGCGQTKNGDPRTYGIYNEILRTLTVTRTDNKINTTVMGHFKCETQ